MILSDAGNLFIISYRNISASGQIMSKWLFLIVTLILMVNCGTGVSEEIISDASSDAPSAALAEELQQILDSGIQQAEIPGIQASISTPRWTWSAAAGNASAITGEPARPGMPFLIASITKTFTAVAVQKLAEEGKLSLEDPIDIWLPSDLAARIPESSTITIRQLLDHTSGIADYDEMVIIEEELKDPSVSIPYSAGIEQAIATGPLYPPGSNYTYSNVNYLLLTMIIDKASGTSFEKYLNHSVLQPAGLNQTYLMREHSIPAPAMSADMVDENGTISAYGSLYVHFDRGAGDIVSTTQDLNRFHQALREGRIISNASVVDMLTVTPQSERTKNNVSSGYGLGYATAYSETRNVTLEGHSGGYPGSFSFMYYYPEKEAYIAINVNTIDETSRTTNNILFPLLSAIEPV